MKQPIRTHYLGHVTGYQPIRDQYLLIRSVPTEDSWEFVEDPFELPYSCEGRVCPNDASELLLVKPGREEIGG